MLLRTLSLCFAEVRKILSSLLLLHLGGAEPLQACHSTWHPSLGSARGGLFSVPDPTHLRGQGAVPVAGSRVASMPGREGWAWRVAQCTSYCFWDWWPFCTLVGVGVPWARLFLLLIAKAIWGSVFITARWDCWCKRKEHSRGISGFCVWAVDSVFILSKL